MIIGYILGGLIIYFIYKFIVGFILPVVRTTSAMKRKMEQMRQPYQTEERSNESNKVHSDASGHASGPSAKANNIFGRSNPVVGKPAKADYIDFEEVKEDQDTNRN